MPGLNPAAAFTAALEIENAAQASGTLAWFDRLTCPEHKTWWHQCLPTSPQHVSRMEGLRWCHRCVQEMTVAVDEVSGTAAIICRSCTSSGDDVNRRAEVAIRASLHRVRQYEFAAAL